jgi:cellulose synthase/poly-beta-1,6-N-acetylglucosamine synthase-like glycosyltransferase
MLRVLIGAAEVCVLALISYNLVTAAWGWRDSAPNRDGRRQRFRVVIPAHNEEAVIAGVCADLRDQAYPPELVSTWVLADRCTDSTAALAHAAGLKVAERVEGPDGKGAALAWYLGEQPLGGDEALVVIDADNRVPHDLLARFDGELAAGHRVLQAYLDVANPDVSYLATASALSYWASNRMVQQARRNLGWTADLGGTGMCFEPSALEAAGGFGSELVEDQALGARLALAGIPVVWLHDLRIRDEKPATAEVAVRQRARWAAGRRAVARRYLWALLRLGRPSAFDLALRLVQPSRMGLALLSALLAVGSAMGLPLLPAWLWGGVAVVQFGLPLAFLVRDGVPARHLTRYPLLALLPVLKMAARLIPGSGWYHTPHAGGR